MRTTQAAGGGAGPATRPIDIVLCCAVGALLLVAVVEYSKAGAAEKKAARAAGDVQNLSGQLNDARNALAAIEKDMADVRLAGADVPAIKRRLEKLESSPAAGAEVSPADLAAAVDAALERRRAEFAADMNRRGEEMAAGVAADVMKRVDLDGLQKSLRTTADNFRRAEPAAERTPEQKKVDETVAKGFDMVAEIAELSRKMRDGEITREQFNEKRGELFRKAQEEMNNLSPEERRKLMEQFLGGGGRRNRDGGGQGQGAGEGEGQRENF